MQKNDELYQLTQNMQGALIQAAFQALTPEEQATRQQQPLILQMRQGRAESPRWMMIQALEFAPEPLSVERFRTRAVYAAPGLSQALLEMLASEDYLDRRGDDYHLTAAGQEMVHKIQASRLQLAEKFSAPEVDLTRLESLLRRVIDSSLRSPTPPGIWCLKHSRNRAPADSDSLPAKIMQYGSDFNAYRDDSHMAAYSLHQVSGQAWEAFATVDSGEADHLEMLFQALIYRGWSRSEWQTALDDLCGRGWLTAQDGIYHPTASGKQVRAQVERQTDACFYAPWDVLSAAEFDETVALMTRLVEVCTPQP